MLVNDHFIGSRILRELRQRGYDGSQMAFYRFLNKVKAEEGRTKACIRYETLPGEQGQYDWSPYTVPLGGCLTKVVVFRLILGFSRRKCHFASLNASQTSAFEGIEHGLWKFGGAPRSWWWTTTMPGQADRPRGHAPAYPPAKRPEGAPSLPRADDVVEKAVMQS